MRLMWTVLAVLMPTMAAAQVTCNGQPIPMQGTYSYSGGTAHIYYRNDAYKVCPTAFLISVESGPLEGLELAFGAMGSLLHGGVIAGGYPAAHINIEPVYPVDHIDLGGIQTYEQFSLVPELADFDFDITASGIGTFTFDEGEAPRCICGQVAEEIEASRELIQLYENPAYRAVAERYNLAANQETSFYIFEDMIVPITEPAREVEGWPNLNYDQLIGAILDGELEADDTTIRTVTNATGDIDSDGDGVPDDAWGVTELQTCEMSLPDPIIMKNACIAGAVLQATHIHESTHRRQCLEDNFLTKGGELVATDGTVFEVDRLPDGTTQSWPDSFPYSMPTTLNKRVESLAELRNLDPDHAARSEIEAHSADLMYLLRFAENFCGGEDGRGNPEGDGLVFGSDEVHPETDGAVEPVEN